ncbi:hypothetical protein, partial [Pseudomonas sp. MD332_8]|uniref:hypothetical protein n=1 Tax=unclassified Pseudomonas TaxID=196821 RepID=UPI0036D29877
IGGKPPPTVRLFDVVADSGDRAHETAMSPGHVKSKAGRGIDAGAGSGDRAHETTLSLGHVKSKGGRGLAPDSGVSDPDVQTDPQPSGKAPYIDIRTVLPSGICHNGARFRTSQ